MDRRRLWMAPLTLPLSTSIEAHFSLTMLEHKSMEDTPVFKDILCIKQVK